MDRENPCRAGRIGAQTAGDMGLQAQGTRVVSIARGWLGTPYLHQGSLKGAGSDCLGLIRGIWRELHADEPETPPAYSLDWGEAGGREVLQEAAARWLTRRQPEHMAAGDVLLFRMRDDAPAKHLGVISALGARPCFIHAYSGHGVVESSLSRPWLRRIAAVYHFPEE